MADAITTAAAFPATPKAVADYFPDTTLGALHTAFDGGTGGQTGFYNVMLNDNNVSRAVSWWKASCAFNAQMRAAGDRHGRSVDGPTNYRYYIGTGSRHTMYGQRQGLHRHHGRRADDRRLDQRDAREQPRRAVAGLD